MPVLIYSVDFVFHQGRRFWETLVAYPESCLRCVIFDVEFCKGLATLYAQVVQADCVVFLVEGCNTDAARLEPCVLYFHKEPTFSVVLKNFEYRQQK